jgi:hypothetical protein
VTVFSGFHNLQIQPLPDLPSESAITRDEENHTTAEVAESEEWPPPGLHAKLLFAAKGARRQLWLGSANATDRAWQGRNFEVVAELSIGRDAADALTDFIDSCEPFTPSATPATTDDDEEALEQARRLLSGSWTLRQRIREQEVEISAPTPPPITDATIELDVATLGGPWNPWPYNVNRIVLLGLRPGQRSNFIQIRVVRGDRICAWLQIAPCDPPPDEERDRALIAQYLDPQIFLLWIRSLLTDEPAHTAGGDWDAEMPTSGTAAINGTRAADTEFMPTVEEILRSWAREPSAFLTADEKVKAYLKELERRALESGAGPAAKLLRTFRQTWDTLASELR